MNELSIIPRPNTVTEAMNVAKMISTSSFAPKAFQNKPADILLAWQMGAELGLSLIQALQNIAVINGKPALYGDAALAVVQTHPHYVNHREWWEGSIKDGTRVAYCAITRKGSPEHVVGFSMDDAKKASLWGKTGPWSQYPDRMLQMRARGFAIRDKFADALRGIITREEAEDYVVTEVAKKEEAIAYVKSISDAEVTFDFSRIDSCESLDELKKLYNELKSQCQDYPEHYKMLNNLVHEHKKFLEDKLVKDEHKNEIESDSISTSSPLPAAI